MTLLRGLRTTARLLRRATIQRHRLDAQKARTDMRDWAKARRERTRHLIELGGLVQKAGLVELVDDDRATLLGAFMELADRLRGSDSTDDDPRHLARLWRRRGLRAFDADQAMPAAHQKDRSQDITDGNLSGG
jgi:hypothetical protein